MSCKESRELAVFDLDRTLISGNCSFAFCQYLVKKRVFSRIVLLRAFLYRIRYNLSLIDLRSLHKGVFEACLKGVPLQVLEEHALPFLSSYLPLSWYYPALFRLRLLQQLGQSVLILSSSPGFLVRQVASFLHVDLWDGTEYAVDREGALCHIAKIMEGEEKVMAMREIAKRLQVPLDRVVAYSDSIEDFPLLSSSARAVAVNPDHQLKAVSQKKGWEIL